MLKELVLEVDPGVAVYTATDSEPAYKILVEKTIDVFLADIILDSSKHCLGYIEKPYGLEVADCDELLYNHERDWGEGGGRVYL